MKHREFVSLFVDFKNELKSSYFEKDSSTHVGRLIKDLNLSSENKVIMSNIIDGALIDAIYNILLGLDGAASIGGKQQLYKLYDESGNLLTGSGEIESNAYDLLQ